MEAASEPSGYLARLLINESPFPGERGYVSEADSKATMLSILWVLHARMNCVPPGYKQEEIAAIRSQNVLEVITAKNQCEGFSKDAAGQPVAAPRVEERLRYLTQIANRGDKPGRFALARGGTIFLDEIADVSPSLQIRLLRVLEERSFEPLGAVRPEQTDARVEPVRQYRIDQA